MLNMSFKDILNEWPESRISEMIAQATLAEVDAAIARVRIEDGCSLSDLAALLSPCARDRLELMAREAQRLTRWHFGRTIGLYAPIYISNVCAADCLYCGFATGSGNRQKRVTLGPEAIRNECRALAKRGFENILLLTGEAPKVAGAEYIAQAVGIAREYFPSVSVEVYPLATNEYRLLEDKGLEGVTLYIETYDPDTYARLHPAGLKRNYESRLNALDRAGATGIRRLNLGVLLGLYDWRIEAFRMALHARHLQKQYWRSAVAVSFPRLRHVPARFAIPSPVNDAALVQLMLALRLYLPDMGFALSTRETPEFRDRLIPLGVTMMSAGSSTRPGGYATYGDDTLQQFEIEDSRSTNDVVNAIIKAGYDPVWKDFDRAFHGAPSGFDMP